VTRPLAVVAVLVLFVNDHWLKQIHPGFVTGKLSDVAGMVFFPLLLHTFVWAAVPARRRTVRLFEQTLLAACLATAIVFALTKTLLSANQAYRLIWGVMLWPLRALHAIARGAASPGFARVCLVRDPSDLVAVPFVLFAWRSGRRAGPRSAAATSATNGAAPSAAVGESE
jgi:hypothetical protein